MRYATSLLCFRDTDPVTWSTMAKRSLVCICKCLNSLRVSALTKYV